MLLNHLNKVITLYFLCIINIGYSQPLSGILPKNNSVENIFTPNLKWNSLSSALNYTVFISQDPTFINSVVQSSPLSTTNWTSSTLGYGVWYWKIIGNTISGPISSTINNFTIYSPTQNPNLSLFLKADAGILLDLNGKVQTWFDQSQNNYSISQTNNNKRPTINTITSLNNTSSLQFSGTQFLNGGDIMDLYNNSRMIYVCGKMGVSNQTLFAKGNWGSSACSFGLMKYGLNEVYISQDATVNNIVASSNSVNYNIYSIFSNRATSNNKYNRNGTQFGLGNLSNSFDFNTNFRFLIGAYNGAGDIGELNFLTGEIHEIIFIDTVDVVENSNISNYLRYKYSPPINLGADITPNNFCPITLTAPTGFTNLLWSTGATSSSVALNQSGTYWVQGTDLFGYVSRDTVMVNYPVITPPLNTNICLNSSVQWNADMGAGFTYLWNTGATTPILNISSPGTYSVQVMDALLCTKNSGNYNFAIDTYSQTTLLGADTSLCIDNLIALQVGAPETISYEWNGLTTAAQAPFWVVDTTGNYFVETVNINGCVAQDTIHITIIGQAPLVNFSFQNQCFGLATQFNDASIGLPNDPVSTWQWDFGNGDEDDEENPNYTYASPGLYSVQLYAESAGGCGAFHTEVLEIHQLPLASFTHLGNCEGQSVNFTNTSVDGDAPISTYLWNFDQQGTNSSTLANPSCLFMNAGNFDVSMGVSDTNGCSDTINISVDILASPNASFTVNNACEEANIVIQNNSTIANPFSLVNQYWLYGDGTFANNPSIAKQYDNYGNYSILLVETASNGCVDSTQQNITIHPNPQLAWEIGPACQFTYTEFTNNSTVAVGNITNTDWLVNLQFPYTSSSATYPFLTAGIQYLNLSTTSDQGCISDTLILVNVAGPLQANFTVVPSDLVAGISSTFINNSIGGNSYLWELGDGVSSLEENVIHSYSNTEIGNTVTVSLQVSNDLGCLDTLDQSYTIGAPHFDLALSNLFCQDIESYWTIGCELKNQGSIAITQANLVASLLNGLPIMENWQGTLAPGESTIYIFQSHPAAYIATQDNYISYVCVEGEGFNALNLLDEELANNTSCRNVENDGVILLPLYPNPGNAFLEVKVFVPQGQEFELGLYDIQGRIIYKYSENEVITDAVKLINIPTQELSSGSYLLRLSDAAGSQIRKWVKE